jgi:hypothetical protein
MHAATHLELLNEAVFAVACPDCEGSGRFDDVDCSHCRGMGAIALGYREPARYGLARPLWRDPVNTHPAGVAPTRSGA